ncbi:MAG: RnfH family protein [Azoarcus sp.]|jgi:putative ubiquitin-RnfH superfamily antitoxin RatB of RatAB toxin-antitoxin module|nr:RnfH family protein [Azoarcus sp.]
MQIGIAYSEPNQQIWMTLDVPESTTLREAIERSGILRQFPHIDLETQKTGIFGKLAKPDAVLKPGDRVEIYRPIIADPETVPRRDKGADGEDGKSL